MSKSVMVVFAMNGMSAILNIAIGRYDYIWLNEIGIGCGMLLWYMESASKQ